MKPRLDFHLIFGDDIAPGPGKVKRPEATVKPASLPPLAYEVIALNRRLESRARKATEVSWRSWVDLGSRSPDRAFTDYRNTALNLRGA